MSGEVIASIVTAVISAAASVVAAVIQAGGRKGPEDAPAAPAAPRRRLTETITKLDFGEATRGRGGVDGVWLALALVLAVETVALATQNPEFSANLNSVIVIPAVTFVMAVARPIGWGYAAGAVTLLHGVVLGASAALSKGPWESAPQVLLLSFVANALLVSGVAFLRTKAKPGALGGAFAALGVLASAWLFVPMIAPRRARPREPERVELEPVRPGGPAGRVRPVRMHPVRVVREGEPEAPGPPGPAPEPEEPVPAMNRRIMLDFRKVRPVDPDAR